jgi:hypothetical protein
MGLVVINHFEVAGKIPVQNCNYQFDIVEEQSVSLFKTNFSILKNARSSWKN